jgi:histidine ammonia-lyase
VDGGPLSIDAVVAVAHRSATAVAATDLEERMGPARRLVEQVLAEDRTVYGVTTGFGALASTRISADAADALQVSLLRSHAAGVGDPLSDEVVRAMLLLRARTLAQGYSGVRPVIVRRLLELLERDLLPVVPSRGSVGASGDLAPFAHLTLPLIGEGRLQSGGEARSAADVLAEHGIEPIRLGAKEGLSLLNGTEGMLALGILAQARAERLARAADIAAALSIEALMGSARPFQQRVHALRPHPGQQASAAFIARLIAGSAIGSAHADDFVHAVQDAYSLRCAPQVHGAARDAFSYSRSVFERELQSVPDNPLVFADTGELVSAGNFHGEPLALALDFMAIAAAELGSISERRTDRLLDPAHSCGLPAFLSPEPGIHSGYMLAQYTAAALVAENRIYAHPASVDSVPTSGSQEDHVSMGWGAGLKLHQVLDNVARIVAVEVLCAVQGIEYRELAPAAATGAAQRLIRASIPPLVDDRPLGREIERVAFVIESGELERAIEEVLSGGR